MFVRVTFILVKLKHSKMHMNWKQYYAILFNEINDSIVAIDYRNGYSYRVNNDYLKLILKPKPTWTWAAMTSMQNFNYNYLFPLCPQFLFITHTYMHTECLEVSRIVFYLVQKQSFSFSFFRNWILYIGFQLSAYPPSPHH